LNKQQRNAKTKDKHVCHVLNFISIFFHVMLYLCKLWFAAVLGTVRFEGV